MNVFLLPVALLISVPQLNALIHGTHVVMAHAMGSELAIDSYILLGAFAWILGEIFHKRESREDLIDGPGMKSRIVWLNLSLVGLVASLMVWGLGVGISRAMGAPPAEVLSNLAPVFAGFGLLVTYSLVRLVFSWAPLSLHSSRHKLISHDERWSAVVGDEWTADSSE